MLSGDDVRALLLVITIALTLMWGAVGILENIKRTLEQRAALKACEEFTRDQ